MPTARILVGDALSMLRTLPDESVHVVCTSPPYWAKRSYGGAPLVWDGQSDCDHEWGAELPSFHPGQAPQTLFDYPEAAAKGQDAGAGTFCQRCGAWRGDLGLEPTPDLFVAHLVTIFREVWRVLHPSGTCWIIIGDTHVSASVGGNGRYRREGDLSKSWAGQHEGRMMQNGIGRPGASVGPVVQPNRLPLPGLKAKDLVMVPSMLALALRADGWWLRQNITWAKSVSFCEAWTGSCMPESVRDRPTTSSETILLLSKRESYFYDADGVREPHRPESLKRYEYGIHETAPPGTSAGGTGPTNVRGLHQAKKMGDNVNPLGRNLRNVWAISTEANDFSKFSDDGTDHFAAMPQAIATPVVKAGTSEKGCCPTCRSPWERVVERTGRKNGRKPAASVGRAVTQTASTGWAPTTKGTDTWRPTCGCPEHEPTPCVALDPFSGTGTTAMVALRFKREAIGIELNPTYARMSERRIVADAPLFNAVELA